VSTTTAYASRAVSPSGDYLAVRDATPADALPGLLTVSYEMTAASATVHWAAMGRLGVLAAGQTAADGTGSIQVTLDAEAAAPAVQLLLWYTSGGGSGEEEEERLVAAHTTVVVAGAARYTVSAAFSTTEAAPGEAVAVQVSGAANARVYVLAVDKSVLLLVWPPSSNASMKLYPGSESRESPRGVSLAATHIAPVVGMQDVHKLTAP
jgi:hypothetical protein